MKPGPIIAAAVIVVGITLSVYAFVTSATPYVSATEAAAQPGKVVHVAGEIDHASARLDLRTNRFEFVLVDEFGERMPVVCETGKPANFDGAPKASVEGAYRDGKFRATGVKTQCPSKYESAEASKG
ncbi:MAG: hypothetical protein AKCLJLPJ_01178 [Fimbriimonadales bacterium]|nr:MAG: hypothetical protein EDM73_11495 [Armatimonadota bacterium]MBV6503114.1 hypothetical protein [Fimbriimonadales bacterium]MCE7900835.1 hypothetical protein [Armatimonadetes bacterium ATM1]MDL1929777.1 cytochrome c maturation protein CcmE [Fimbriimonadia bacterium ATM]MBC6970524.1 hypothetical protein [Armatimonadota bacterium]